MTSIDSTTDDLKSPSEAIADEVPPPVVVKDSFSDEDSDSEEEEESASNNEDDPLTSTDAAAADVDDLNGGSEVTADIENDPPPVVAKDSFSDEDSESEDETDDEDAVDPFSFPETPEGLEAFLSAIDNDDSGVELPRPMIYQATSMVVEAAAGREIHIPIIEPESMSSGGDILVDWEASVEENDVGFYVSVISTANMKENSGEEETPESEVENKIEVDVKLAPDSKGSFAMPHSSDDSKSILLEFDNTYSWFTPKNVSYKITITMTPPADVEKVRRAKKALASVSESLVGRRKTVDEERAKRETLERSMRERETELDSLEVEAASVKQKLDTVQAEEEQSKEEASAASKKVATVQTTLSAELRQMEELKKRMRELELELQVREEHVKEIQNDLGVQSQSLKDAESKASLQREQVQSTQADLDTKTEHLQEKRTKVLEIKKDHNAVVAKEKESAASLDFLEGQQNALMARLV